MRIVRKMRFSFGAAREGRVVITVRIGVNCS